MLIVHVFNFIDDEFGEKTVSILLDGEESEIVFIDHPSSEMSVSFLEGRPNDNEQNCIQYTGCRLTYSFGKLYFVQISSIFYSFLSLLSLFLSSHHNIHRLWVIFDLIFYSIRNWSENIITINHHHQPTDNHRTISV